MDLRKASLLLITVVALGTSLVGCASSDSNNSNTSSSSQSSSQSASQKEVYPTKTTIEQAWKDTRSMEKDNSLLEKNLDDKYIRFSDVVNFNQPTKYTGSVQTVSGTVKQVEDYTSGEYGKGYKQLTVETGTDDKSKVYLIDVKPSMPVREDDDITTIGVIAGPVRYYNTDDEPIEAIYSVAPTDQFKNIGTTE